MKGSRYITGFVVAWMFMAFLNVTRSQDPYFQQVRLSGPAADQSFRLAFQDSMGYIWLGSPEGLFRYDGYLITEFQPPSDSIPLHVTALSEDRKSRLWVGCQNGHIFRLEGNQLILFDPEEGTSQAAVSDIMTDSGDVLWWSTRGEGIYYYAAGRVFNINHEDGLTDDYVYELEEGSPGEIWAATDGGIAICQINEGAKSVYAAEVNAELPDILVKSMCKDPSGLMLVGFQDAGPGYVTMDGKAFRPVHGSESWSYGPVEELVITQGAIWAATPSSGIIRIKHGLNQQTMNWSSDGKGNPFGKLFDLMSDREGNIWILTGSGLFKSPGTRFSYIRSSESLPLRDVHAIIEDSKGMLWFSTEDGLFRQAGPGRTDRFLAARPGIKVMSLDEDHHGIIWAGTFNQGVFRIDPATGAFRQLTERDGLINDNILSISIHEDTLWLATLGGATRLILNGSSPDSPINFTSFNEENGLVNNFIYTVFEDSKDRIWFGTDGNGLSMWSKGRFKTYDAKDGIRNEVVYSITEDGWGNIWFTTAGDGIYQYDGNNFKRYGSEHGLIGHDIASLAASGDELLIVHGTGVDVLEITTGRIVPYREEVGLGMIKPGLNAIDKDSQGNIRFGTHDAIVLYEPGFTGIFGGPQTTIEDMMIFLQPVPMTENASFPKSRNHISFSYTGFWYTDPSKVIYQVMLEGFDLGWMNTFDRMATYSSLPAGDYVFRVRSALDPSFKHASEASFSFRIRKPIYSSAWFIILVVLALAATIYFVIRIRERRLRETERRKKEKIEFEFQVLKNQVNPHFLFNSFSTLMALIEEQPGQALDYTEKLSDFFRTILQYRDREVIPVSEELDLIENYFYIQKRRYGDHLILSQELPGEILDTFIPPLTLQILMENAVKHNIISKDMPLTIRIYSRDGYIVVENNIQRKKQPEASTGIGLENISKRYALSSGLYPKVDQSEQFYKIWLPIIIK